MSLEKYTIDVANWQFENGRLSAMLRGNAIEGFQYSFDGDQVNIVLFW